MHFIGIVHRADVRKRTYCIHRIPCIRYHFSEYSSVCILYFNFIVCRFKEYPISIFICRSGYRKDRNKLSAVGVDGLVLFSLHARSLYLF